MEMLVTTYLSCKTCNAQANLSPTTNQHPVFYRPDALPVADLTVSKHWREIGLDALFCQMQRGSSPNWLPSEGTFGTYVMGLLVLCIRLVRQCFIASVFVSCRLWWSVYQYSVWQIVTLKHSCSHFGHLFRCKNVKLPYSSDVNHCPCPCKSSPCPCPGLCRLGPCPCPCKSSLCPGPCRLGPCPCQSSPWQVIFLIYHATHILLYWLWYTYLV